MRILLACVLLIALPRTFSILEHIRPEPRLKVPLQLGNVQVATALLQQGTLPIARRRFVTAAVSLIVPITPLRAVAYTKANGPVTKEELTRLRVGLGRLDYLLANWKQVTTESKKVNEYGNYDRNPTVVMDYMGFKSSTDPLFKADRLLVRAQDLVADKDYKVYAEALDVWSLKADEAMGMAFVSSWGEANPGGGKDVVEAYIERAKSNVTAARDALATCVRILDL